ncbi:hypothetical protein [Bacillus velezensis]|uniref:hypothetical protein n=1 Tax=Bacillus velezensis TaxID=492670 RepID=UPI00280A9DF5|nr:hypothetical protein [Bacillus velezensis]
MTVTKKEHEDLKMFHKMMGDKDEGKDLFYVGIQTRLENRHFVNFIDWPIVNFFFSLLVASESWI